jgi:holo-[acyl-carrier protein] synthase
MLETGVDIIEVDRVQAAITQHGQRFLRRVFTESEIIYCRGRSHELAARFAAKEALSKLLGVGIQHRDGVDWLEIEVVSGERGKPSVKLTGRAARRAQEIGITTLSLSLSHSRDHAIAMVVAQ